MKNKKSAFTMAEVLITLSLIGVVATITIPSVITNFQVKTNIAKAKKAKFEISQAAAMIQISHPRWRDAGNASDVKGYFDDMLKSSADVKYWYGSNYSVANDGCPTTGSLIIGADVGSGSPAVIFCATRRGAVEDDSNFSLSDYENEKKARSGVANRATVKGSTSSSSSSSTPSTGNSTK